MQLKYMNRGEHFISAFYELTWPAYWEQVLTFADVLIHKAFWPGQADGSHPIKVEKGGQPGDPPEDVTDQVSQAGWDVLSAAFAREECGFVVVTGYAAAFEVDMRITLWTNTNQCLLQLRDDKAIAQTNNERYYDRFADSMEIWLHVETVKRHCGKQ